MFDRSTDDDDGRHDDEEDDDVDYDDGSYKDTRHSESVCALSQSTANGHVSSPGAPPSVRVKSRRRRRSPLPPPHLPSSSNVCDLLQILRNLSSLYRILNLIMCDDIINFKMLTATRRVGEGEGGGKATL